MQKGEAIIKFSKEHYFLSNMYPCLVTYQGLTYQSSEAAFQAQKAPEKDRIRFTEIDGKTAKKLAGKHGSYVMSNKALSEWNDKSLAIMEEIVRAKFTQNQDLAELLVKTGNLRLIEGNNHDDNLYGIQLERVPGSRKKLKLDEEGYYILSTEETENNNRLGKILMKIRAELKAE